ncbi:MAG: hypothetical protein Q9227_006242 [Pyrenula ochraceoflavens]
MNHTQSYLDMHPSHMSSAQPYASQAATTGGLSHYSHYQQPPVLQPNVTNYAPSPSSYTPYGYPNGVTSPHSGAQPSGGMHYPSLPAMAAPPHGYPGGLPGPQQNQHMFDQTGQTGPPGVKPRVTATLWEDEGTLCFQVETNGVCVARREDNHMINGTKLLNVAGMTRGRRDGILKSEKHRQVVKIGPMHLKGVWIPFERALDFANKEKITDKLYPLFVHNINGLLYHPSNERNTSALATASERRRADSNATRPPTGSQPPALHHHHSMMNPTGPNPTQSPHSIAPHPGSSRPGIDRAHTMPTPPASASSVVGMGSQSNSYEWSQPNLATSVSGAQPLSIDTGIGNPRSMPNTPATTPPGTNMQNMTPYQGQQHFDQKYYSGPPPSQASYTAQPTITQQNMARFGQPMPSNTYSKSDMGPPSLRGNGSGAEADTNDIKQETYPQSTSLGQVGHGHTEGEAEPEHETDYSNNANSGYSTARSSYAYGSGANVGSLHSDHSQVSPEMNGSPHQDGSGRGTPRNTNSQTQWTSAGYSTPPRQAPSSNLYSVMSDPRSSATNGSTGDSYAASSYSAPHLNGIPASSKRSREDDDGDNSGRPGSQGLDPFDIKRRRTLLEDGPTQPLGGISAVQEIDIRTFNEIAEILFATIPYYNDRPSRSAVQTCLRAVFHHDPQGSKCLKAVTKYLEYESSKRTISSSHALVLLEWCTVIQQEYTKHHDFFNASFNQIVHAVALAFEKCVSSSARGGVRRSAILIARRGFRSIFKHSDLREQATKIAISELTAKTPIRENAPILGVIAGVSARIPSQKDILLNYKTAYISFYKMIILGSKTSVPTHIANGLSDFFSSFVNQNDVLNDILPSFEKTILRSPEIVLDGLIPQLVQSLPPSVDLSEILHRLLLQPLLSCLKSSNSTVREGSYQAFRAWIQRCQNENFLSKFSSDLLSAFISLKASNNEQKILLARFLNALPQTPQVSSKLVRDLAGLISRESNETVIEPSVKALCSHLIYLVSHGSLTDKSVTELVVKGCGDKRPGVRRAWCLNLGASIWHVDPAKLLTADHKIFMVNSMGKLYEAFKEIVSNPISAASSGLLPIGYVLVAIVEAKFRGHSEWPFTFKKDDLLSHCLVSSPKPPFLLNSKIYTKLNRVENLQWLTSALRSLVPDMEKSDPSVMVAWAEAIIYLLTAPELPSVSRQHTKSSLVDAYQNNPSLVSKAIVSGSWRWLRSLMAEEKDSPAMQSKAGNASLHEAISCITLRPAAWENRGLKFPEGTCEEQALSLLVLCSGDLIPRIDWIEASLRMGVDPGALSRKRSKDCLNLIREPFENYSDTDLLSRIRTSACTAAAQLAFVAPENLIPLLVHQFEEDLGPALLDGVSPLDVAIANTPDGVVFVDVLNSKSHSNLTDKNVKDYDTLKWEEELRTQVAQKKGAQKKLTVEEQTKVNTQLAKEAKIRERIRTLQASLERGAGIIESMATGPPTDATLWLNNAVSSLIRAIKYDGELVTAGLMARAYLACSNLCSTRLEELRKSVGVAALRATNKCKLPPEYEAENLGDLVLRVLYRLRFAAEQVPFDAVTLSYVLPFLFPILESGGVGCSQDENAESQVLLALEFLNFHSETCAELHLPRTDIIACLIQSMQKYGQHHRLLRDTLMDLCGFASSNIAYDEITVLLRGCAVSDAKVRNAVLQVVQTQMDLTEFEFLKEIWLCCHDLKEDNAEIANTIWEENGLDVDEPSVYAVSCYLTDRDRSIRDAAANAIAHGIEENPLAFANVLQNLQSEYTAAAKPVGPEKDKYGMVKRVEVEDKWYLRSGIASTLKAMSSVFEPKSILPFMRFLIYEGPLTDRNATVRSEMVDSGMNLIALKGNEQLEALMDLFEQTLESSDKQSSQSDWVNEAVVLLYGSLARHLRPGDARVSGVITKLLSTLSTPSESVQYAISGCLPPLIQLVKSEGAKLIPEMMDQLLKGKSFAERRGAAYGLSGLISGMGVSALRDTRVLTVLHSAIENKKSADERQGALFAYEVLSTSLGRNFEPYVIQILPQLLGAFGDPTASVREACLDTAKACFSGLSSFGVKKVLPQLLEGLEEPQWRSKKGACDLLGAMAYLDPQQLADSLPAIIPPLTNVLNDSHKEVRGSANRSLQRFGEVLSNPEVKGLVDILLKALSDPTKFTDEALDSLIKISFTHYLDAPSLALVVRILQRGLNDRSATKRKAAQIIGSLAHLTDRRDLISHLPMLVAGLRSASVDPVPATRATASKALGSLVEKLGEDALPDLIPSLMANLKSDTGAGDRLGSAQALSEVLAGLGTARLDETLPTILQNASSSKSSVREGFMTLFIFLPACFGNSFASYLSKIIPPILSGLADDFEAIRDISLRAGRLLVKNFATKAIDLLLPELQRGLADDMYRIRLSSVELVGDLLFNLTGISNKAENDEDDEGAAKAGQSLLDVLGEEKRNNVLSSIYICRCDTSGLVRSAAIAVWKALVATPRTLRELIPTLTQLIIGRLASTNMEQKVIASNALGEVIRKAGEGVLATLLPALNNGLQSSMDADTRQGIAIALREVITAASPEALEDYEKTLIGVVRTALVDQDPSVREAAAEAFDSLQQTFGKRAIDQVLPYLLNLLQDEHEAQNSLSALLTLLNETTRANVILPNLIPTLIASPISAFNARALGSLAQVAGPSMTRRIPAILNALMDNLVSVKDDELKEAFENAFDSVLNYVDEFDGLNTAMNVMLGLLKHDDHLRRATAASHLASFFSKTTIDFSRYDQDLVRVLLISFDDRDAEVVKTAWSALNQLTLRLKKEEMESLVVSTRQILRQVGIPGVNLPGFSIPKGINAILPIFIQGLMNGTIDQRIQASLAISDIIDRTEPNALKPFVTQITGPLIRVVSERSIDVKCAILHTLNQLLEKIPTFLRPFLPQLQRTFTKALADPSSSVLRDRAARALGTLITLTPRVDPLITGN